MNWFYKIEKFLSVENYQFQSIKLYRKGIYLIIFFITFQYYLNTEFFFGPNSLVGAYYYRSHFLDFLFQLLHFEWFEGWANLFLLGLMMSCLVGFLGFINRLISIFIFLLYINITIHITHITNAGQQLLSLLLFYNIFLSENKSSGYYGNILSNLAVYGSKIQIAILYLTAGLLKLTGELWINGSAFLYMINIPEYSHPYIAGIINEFSWLSYPFSWFALLYQLLFPFLVWIDKVKYKLFFFGLIFHLGIAFINGIMDFGLIMIASYIIFYDNEKSFQIFSRFDSLIRKAGIRNISNSGV